MKNLNDLFISNYWSCHFVLGLAKSKDRDYQKYCNDIIELLRILDLLKLNNSSSKDLIANKTIINFYYNQMANYLGRNIENLLKFLDEKNNLLQVVLFLFRYNFSRLQSYKDDSVNKFGLDTKDFEIITNILNILPTIQIKDKKNSLQKSILEIFEENYRRNKSITDVSNEQFDSILSKPLHVIKILCLAPFQSEMDYYATVLDQLRSIFFLYKYTKENGNFIEFQRQKKDELIKAALNKKNIFWFFNVLDVFRVFCMRNQELIRKQGHDDYIYIIDVLYNLIDTNLNNKTKKHDRASVQDKFTEFTDCCQTSKRRNLGFFPNQVIDLTEDTLEPKTSYNKPIIYLT